MKQVLYDYDVFPMVFPAHKEIELTIRPLGAHAAFAGEYLVSVHRLDSGCSHHAFYAGNKTEYRVAPDAEGCLRIAYTAAAEGELFIRVQKEERRIAQLCVYALEEDLACRVPLRGDLHMHTCRSDGREAPAVVCANYRKKGYDFIVVTDHHRYYPSLEAIDAYRDVKTALNILPGEEVHLPFTDVHIVNAGGLFSVNGMLTCKENYTETNGAPDKRRLNESVALPDVRTLEEFAAEVDAIAATLENFPEGEDRRSYAVCRWAFDRIREADGVGIFAHPYWIADMWHVTEVFTRYMMENHPFDAFEVLGGENYYEQNGFQTALYYEEYRAGRVHPVVGSTDSHGSTEHNRNAAICSTIVFAKENGRAAILDAIREKYSVAVDTISAEYRLVGEFRLQKYASFLMENYFPVHDRQAAMDGELMFQYATGNATAQELELIAARAQALQEKYIRLA